VNTVSIKNPVGMHIGASEFLPFVMQALQAALDDLRPAEVAGTTAHCEQIVVFGSNQVSQLASTINAMLVFIAPLSLAMLLLAFLLSLAAYIVII
jgi:putative membrane protein